MADVRQGRRHLRVIKGERLKISARPLEDTQEMRCERYLLQTALQCNLWSTYSCGALRVLQGAPAPWWRGMELRVALLVLNVKDIAGFILACMYSVPAN